MRSVSHRWFEELTVPIVFLAIGVLLAVTTLAGGATAAREGGLAVVMLVAGAAALRAALAVR